ncbi:MAG: NAD(P)/FAD-dependent oxidoreductase [Terricaulis sp.]
MGDFHDVLIIGAGAAGLAAGRRLQAAKIPFLIVEARDRIGGRGWTRADRAAFPLDIGCEWLHSAEKNVWREKAAALGFHVEQAPAPWRRQSGQQGFSAEDQAAFGEAFNAFEERIDQEAEKGEPLAASAFLEPGGRWNPLINGVFSFISGATLEHIDARDYARYEDTGLNWRVREGYGALIATYGADLPVQLETRVTEIDHSGLRVRVFTNRGVLEARAVIIAVPTTILLTLALTPDLPHVREAAEGLPLGFAEKAFFALNEAEEFPVDGHLFARTDSAAIGSYHLRSLGRPVIEAYYGAELARGLAQAGEAAMIDFALEELTALLGASIRTRVTPLTTSHWAADPYARGSYSYAKPGRAEERAVLAAPQAGRLFFAGEAASRARYSTAHGAYETGIAAAEHALAALAGQQS